MTVVEGSLFAVVAAAASGLALWLLMPPQAPLRPSDGRASRSLAPPALVIAIALLLPHAWAGPLLVLVPASWFARLLLRRRHDARSAESNAGRMAEVCDLLAAELAAGQPPEAALRQAAMAWPTIAPVAEVCRLGGDVPGALHEAALAPGASGLRLLAAAWTVAQRTGGGLAAATRRVAEAVRRDQATRQVVNGELASARATARLMAGLPVLALLMGSGAGGDPWGFLLSTPAGLACFGAGLTAALCGLWWIEEIAREVDR